VASDGGEFPRLIALIQEATRRKLPSSIEAIERTRPRSLMKPRAAGGAHGLHLTDHVSSWGGERVLLVVDLVGVIESHAGASSKEKRACKFLKRQVQVACF